MMRLYDLITIYEDVIKKHDMFAEFNRYNLILLVDGEGGAADRDICGRQIGAWIGIFFGMQIGAWIGGFVRQADRGWNRDILG